MRVLFAVLLLAALAQARIRIVCPAPAPGGDNENQIPSAASPCGTDVNMADPSITFTELAPGFQSIMWMETVSVEDSPFSIRLCNRTGDCSYVLVDHVPHLNIGRQVLQSSPAARFENRPFMLSIPIPNIACNNCFLQLLQIGRESYNSADDCTFAAAQAGSCTKSPNVQYVACAPININGSAPFVSNPSGANGLDYTIPNGWPHSDRTAGTYRQSANNNAGWRWDANERNTLIYGYRADNPGGNWRTPIGTCNKMFTTAQVNFKSAFYDPSQYTPAGAKSSANSMTSVLSLFGGFLCALLAMLL